MASDVPGDVWESYSAFANTEGGEIVLGVTENDDHVFTVAGVVEPDRLVADFWTTVRNRQKANGDVLFADSVRAAKVRGLDVVIINVPRAERSEDPVMVKKRLAAIYDETRRGAYLSPWSLPTRTSLWNG